MSNAVMTSRQAAELDFALERNGWTAEDVKNLSKGDFLTDVRQVLLGYSEIKILHVIDLNAAPFNPWANNGFVIDEHQKGGQWKLDFTQVKFRLVNGQKNGIQGNKVRKALAGQPIFNANLLDYLLAHPELIPEDWKQDENGNTRYIFFWGTIYRNRKGNLFVRCFFWRDGRWYGSHYWLGSDWYEDYPAVVCVS